MKFVLQTNVISPHQLPLAKELVRHLGTDDFRYLYSEDLPEDRRRMGWIPNEDSVWCRRRKNEDECLWNCMVLLTGIRDCVLFERRLNKGLRTFYMSERWFKPIKLFDLKLGDHRFVLSIPGWARMWVPRYRKMAKRFVQWIQQDPYGSVFAIGPWAKMDMLRLGVPKEKIVPWGYFVAPSVLDNYEGGNQTKTCEPQTHVLNILWVGRLLHWKCVDTILRALLEQEKSVEGEFLETQLTIVGDGPEKSSLQRLANRLTRTHVTFLPSQPIDQIRAIMRGNDVYVLSSNAQEGWGAALNEALEEGMLAIGTHEAGASATMLGDEWLFHVGDYRRLAGLLIKCAAMKRMGVLHGQGIGEWSVKRAAEKVFKLLKV